MPEESYVLALSLLLLFAAEGASLPEFVELEHRKTLHVQG